MDLQERYNSLKLKSIRFKASANQSLESANDLKMQYEDIVRDLEAEEKSVTIQESSINILKEIIDRASQEHIERIVDLLTYALQTIFFDRDYSVEVVMGDKRNSKTAEFFLVEKTENEVITSPFEDGIGGGILAVVGFVLQVYYLGYMSQSPIMFCDEALSQVSEQYKTPLFSFIKELADKKDFIFVLITHDQSIMALADKTYRVTLGNVKEVKTGAEQ